LRSTVFLNGEGIDGRLKGIVENLSSLDVLPFILGIDFDNDGIVSLGATTHRNPVKGDSFALDGLDEIHEGRRASEVGEAPT
jgi:hypothetical protein